MNRHHLAILGQASLIYILDLRQDGRTTQGGT
jgi:hypothetical protein